MSNGIKYTFIFTIGAAIGSAVTWKIVKTKYEQIAQEEIDSVKEVYSRKLEGLEEPECENNVDDDMTTYEDVAKNYTSSGKTNEKGGSESMTNKPFVIPPEELGEVDDYDVISLTYYADEVLTDDMDVPIDNIDDIIGIESLDHFGEYEDDSVCVRNPITKVDYEILLDKREYSDIAKRIPNPADDE